MNEENVNGNKELKKNIFEKTHSKSIFNYITDPINYKNKNECTNYKPPFISYMPIGVPNKNINIDSSLKGMNQYLSKCTELKYRQNHQEQEFKQTNLKNNECDYTTFIKK